MAVKPGPLLIIGGLGALFLVSKKKSTEPDTNGKYEDLPEPPGPGPGPVPRPEPQPEPIEVEQPGGLLSPGDYGVLTGAEYYLPFKKGIQGDMIVMHLTADGGLAGQAKYGPNEDYIWEKETDKENLILQFQKPGFYSVALWESEDNLFSQYTFKAIEG